MVGAVAGATVQAVLQNLVSFPMEEIGLICNFNKDLKKLKQSFLMIQDFLEDAEKRQVTDRPVQRWLMKLEALAFEADYVFDQLNYQLLRKKVVQKKVSSLFSTTIPVAFRYRMARKIKEMKNEMRSINKEAMELGLQMRIASSHGCGSGIDAPTYLETDSFSVDSVFIGRDDEVVKIVEMVTERSLTDDIVVVLPIFGMGGLGKTTLARKVCKDANIISHFGKSIWVHVSEKSFDPLTVLKGVVTSSTGENVDGSREVIMQKLQKSLGNKKCLLVLDNVWNEYNDNWENFMSSLKGISSVKGNVIVVTTRSENVANIVKTLGVYELGILSEHDCWLIIKAKAFEGEVVPSMFEIIGANIAKRCGGLQLAAQVVGGLLRGKPKHEWASIEKNWLSSFGRDGNIVSKILKLSFDNLPSVLIKRCFALCSIFPKGCSMEKDELIHIWMAEGLLQIHEDIDLEIFGNRVFNILLQSSLLQVLKRDWFGNVQTYGMHDLVYDLASSILNSTFLDGALQVRYMSTPLTDEPSPISEEQAKCLRALFYTGTFLQNMCSSLTCLHVLILHDDELKELPSEVGNIISLRYLDISYTMIKSLPDTVGKLHLLQTLRATEVYSGASCLEKLPSTLKFMVSLRHLFIPNIKLPSGIGKLSSLQTLPYFQVGDEEGCRITELGRLKNLKGTIEIHNLEKVHDKQEAKTADLFHKTNILKLKLIWNDSRKDDQNNDENVLEGLQSHMNLESLEIKGFKGSSFPAWVMRMEVREDVGCRWIRLDSLSQIRLLNCKECEEIPMMGQLASLKSLYLKNLCNVKCMSSSFYGINEDDVNKETVIVFPALEKLVLIGMESLTIWAEVGLSRAQPDKLMVFPSLEYLKISKCRQLKSTPSHFPILKVLEIDDMESGLPLENICGSKLTTLKKLLLRKVDGIVHLPNEFFISNRGLLNLYISDCKNLSYLVPCLVDGGASLRTLRITRCLNFEKFPNDLYKLNALEELRIWNCPNVKSIAYSSGKQSSSYGFTSLRCLQFCFCNGLMYLAHEMLESCALSLETLSLEGSTSLTNLVQVMSIMHKMSRLKTLNILWVPGLANVAVAPGSIGGLEELIVGPDYLDNVFTKSSLDRILPAFLSLGELGLHGMKEWDALPDQLQHLTGLQRLYLYSFGIEVLSEWLEMLSSLKHLALWNCKNLRHLPSRRAIDRLITLNIVLCPMLTRNLEKEEGRDDSERSKVSQIPIITLDGRPFSPHAW